MLHKLVMTITCKNIIYGCSIRGPLVLLFPNAKSIWHERGALVLMNQFQQRMMPSIAPTIQSNTARKTKNPRTWCSQMSAQKLFLFSYSKPRGERKVHLPVTPNLSQFNTPEAANIALATQSNCYAKLAVSLAITCERIVDDRPIRGSLDFFFPNAK